MSTKEALKELQDYFTDVEWNDHAVKKVENLVNNVRGVPNVVIKEKIVHKVRTITKWKYVYLDKSPEQEIVNFNELAEKVSNAHRVPLTAIYSKSRKQEYVNARADFVWRVKRRNPNQSLVSIGRYMRKHHTTIIHLMEGLSDGKYLVGVGEDTL